MEKKHTFGNFQLVCSNTDDPCHILGKMKWNPNDLTSSLISSFTIHMFGENRLEVYTKDSTIIFKDFFAEFIPRFILFFLDVFYTNEKKVFFIASVKCENGEYEFYLNNTPNDIFAFTHVSMDLQKNQTIIDLISCFYKKYTKYTCVIDFQQQLFYIVIVRNQITIQGLFGHEKYLPNAIDIMQVMHQEKTGMQEMLEIKPYLSDALYEFTVENVVFLIKSDFDKTLIVSVVENIMKLYNIFFSDIENFTVTPVLQKKKCQKFYHKHVEIHWPETFNFDLKLQPEQLTELYVDIQNIQYSLDNNRAINVLTLDDNGYEISYWKETRNKKKQQAFDLYRQHVFFNNCDLEEEEEREEQKREEQKRKKSEQKRKKQQERKRKKEAEEQKKQQEQLKKKQEEQEKKQQERKRKEEAEQKKKQEAEQMKQQEQLKKKQEQLKKKQEQLKKKQEEQQMKQKEQQMKQKEEQMKQEAAQQLKKKQYQKQKKLKQVRKHNHTLNCFELVHNKMVFLDMNELSYFDNNGNPILFRNKYFIDTIINNMVKGNTFDIPEEFIQVEKHSCQIISRGPVIDCFGAEHGVHEIINFESNTPIHTTFPIISMMNTNGIYLRLVNGHQYISNNYTRVTIQKSPIKLYWRAGTLIDQNIHVFRGNQLDTILQPENDYEISKISK